MTKIDDGGPAYPRMQNNQQDHGMSVRQVFAGQQMAAMRAACHGIEAFSGDVAKRAVQDADALIAALKEGEDGD